MLGPKIVQQNSPFIVDRSIIQDRALLLANGPSPSKDELGRLRALSTTFIAVDGGANAAFRHGVTPDIIIGDCDSVDEQYLALHPHHRIADQETNDLEKALSYCVEHDIKRVLLAGCLGLRLDHTLTNLTVMARFSQLIDMVLIDEHQLAFICPIAQEVHIIGNIGDFLSLFPLHAEVGPISLSGVAHPFEHLYMDPMKKVGTLNRIVAPNVSLKCLKGLILLILPRSN